MGATLRLADQVVLGAIPPEFAEAASSFHGLLGRSPGMRQAIRQMQQIAPSLGLASVEGEDGTGKTLAARALHCAGPAAKHPFVPCMASHFFRGSNGGRSGRRGDFGHSSGWLFGESFGESSGWSFGWSGELLARANRGMLFLDRVHLLDAWQQDLLGEFLHYWENLRAAADGDAEADGLGASGTSPWPAQIVVSASVDLQRSNQSLGGRSFPVFRDDLASKLVAVRFRLPPLRERREDIPLLAQIFIQRFASTYVKQVRGLGPGTIAPLLRHVWSGNVRELEQVIVAACVRTESQWIRPIDLPPLVSETRPRPAAETGKDDLSEVLNSETFNLDEVIRRHVTRVLERVRGNKLKAAQLLGISRSTLYRILGNGGEGPRAIT